MEKSGEATDERRCRAHIGQWIERPEKIRGKHVPQKTTEDVEWRKALGSQRPGGHKVHLEAAGERRPLGTRERGEDREWQLKKAVGTA